MNEFVKVPSSYFSLEGDLTLGWEGLQREREAASVGPEGKIQESGEPGCSVMLGLESELRGSF